MAEFSALMVAAIFLGGALGIGWLIGTAIRQLRGRDASADEDKQSSKERRGENKSTGRGRLPHAWRKGRFPPHVPVGQPMRTQERQQPPHQNIYLFFGPQDGVTDSESPERREGGPGRGNRPGPFRPEDIFPGGGRGG